MEFCECSKEAHEYYYYDHHNYKILSDCSSCRLQYKLNAHLLRKYDWIPHTHFQCRICKYYTLMVKLPHMYYKGKMCLEVLHVQFANKFRDTLYSRNIPFTYENPLIHHMHEEWWYDKMLNQPILRHCPQCRTLFKKMNHEIVWSVNDKEVEHTQCLKCDTYLMCIKIPNTFATYIIGTNCHDCFIRHFKRHNHPFPLDNYPPPELALNDSSDSDQINPENDIPFAEPEPPAWPEDDFLPNVFNQNPNYSFDSGCEVNCEVHP